MKKLVTLPILGISAALLVGAGAMPASASVIQDPASGTCYVDIALNQSTLKLSTTDDQYVTGKVSNPNNCDNLFPIPVNLADRNGTSTQVDTDNLGRFTFNINSRTYGGSGTLLEYGKLSVVTKADGYYNYRDADNDQQRGDVLYTSNPSVTIKDNARISLGASRHGKVVKFTVKSTQFAYGYNGWGGNNDPIKVQQLKGEKWVTVKTVRPNGAGTAHVNLTSKKKGTWRAITAGDASTWSATSKSVKR